MLVNMYADIVTSMPATMALELIQEDLAKESGSEVELEYFSLARAISRFKKKSLTNPGTVDTRTWNFRDDNEIKEKGQLGPGKFKIG